MGSMSVRLSRVRAAIGVQSVSMPASSGEPLQISAPLMTKSAPAGIRVTVV
jgi:hypothetical protein